MPINPIFIGAFVFLFIFCIAVGLISRSSKIVQLCKIVPLRKLVNESFVLLLTTEECGKGGSSNSDYLVADALKNQNFALPVTLKLMKKG